MGYLTGLVKRGYTIGMDHLTWGTESALEADPKTLSWQQRARCVKTLIDAGYGKKLFLSNDWYFGISIAGTGIMEVLEKRNPDGMLFNTRKTIPYLRKIGVSEQEIQTITVENPRRFFGRG
jgi:predicted metal-dependent phosphotriesterase family hydrolase